MSAVLHKDKAEDMGIKGREAVIKKFNWEKEEEALIAFYRKVFYENR